MHMDSHVDSLSDQHTCTHTPVTVINWILSDAVLVWLPVGSEVQTVCMWSSWCHCHPKPIIAYIHTYIWTVDNAPHSSQAQGLNLRRGRSLCDKRRVDINDEKTDGFLDDIQMSWNCWEIGWIAVTCSKLLPHSNQEWFYLSGIGLPILSQKRGR